MDGAVVTKRMVGGRPMWGFDACDMFFPFKHKADATVAAAQWSEEFIRKIGGLSIESCPLAPESEEA